MATASPLSHQLDYGPSFSLLTVRLEPGQKVYSEPGAMTWMDPAITLKAGFKGGFGKTMGRMFAGESLAVSTYSAQAKAGSVAFAPGCAGAIDHYQLATGRELLLQRGAFLAHGEGVELSAKWDGARGFFGGMGLVLLKASGSGDLWFNTYGAIIPIEVDGEYLVDNGYIVAFETTLDYQVTTLPSLRPSGTFKSFFLGGEGLVTRFSGRGRLWIQTRQVGSYLGWVWPFRPASND